MKIIWTNFAIENLKAITKYYAKVAGKSIAYKIKTEIFKSTKQLKHYPDSGQEEIFLKQLNEGYRYIVSGNYKVIYKRVAEGVLITDIFDTRQDPVKINNPKRKHNKD
ncbi:type II toxin-antitoxin system RelE/ParE family toxin [Pedobacter puniceum]|jgi:plasmid stabilization system protein ParE|uniref:Type II toxin-antitoxin system RelE/ParE family toxin n=1 Tax=Pedobacter puniceum TaxID=2666136 RepID=A0A7K0FMV5_9SPHI|nr:type II toxin-antitoxin system RelE/ParE family toxin [Pedobacter puniceum]MRX47298.1 type II toxin-antitoxin system RelE/ParE family toxin [Pedobacter puniceum]